MRQAVLRHQIDGRRTKPSGAWKAFLARRGVEDGAAIGADIAAIDVNADRCAIFETIGDRVHVAERRPDGDNLPRLQTSGRPRAQRPVGPTLMARRKFRAAQMPTRREVR